MRLFPKLVLSLAMFAARAYTQSTPTITEFSNIPGNPVAITVGPDGAIWFAGTEIGSISTTGAATIPQAPSSGTCVAGIGCSGGGAATPSNIQANGIVTGPDGALWFTNFYGGTNTIGRITTGGTLTQFPVPVSGSSGYVNQITAGADGALWFTVGSVAGAIPQTAVWRVTTTGMFTSYPTSGTPLEIIVGPDYSIWFTESIYDRETAAATSWLGRIDRSTAALTEYPCSAPFGVSGIALGPGGQMWIGAVNRVLQATINGVVASYPVSQENAYGMNYGPDGLFWFDGPKINSLGAISLAGVITSYPIPTPNSGPGALVTGLDGAIWFVETNTDKIARLPLSNTPPTPFQITTSATLPTGTVGTPYSQTLTASGGTSPYVWSRSAGSLPTGLSLSTAGVISGTPTTSGVQTFTIQVTDANSLNAAQPFTVTMNASVCTYTVSTSAIINTIVPESFPAAGGGGTAQAVISTETGCPWSASGAPSWVTFPGGVSGTGSAIFAFSAQPNYSPNPRSGTITVAGATISFAQQAGLIPNSGTMPHLAAEGGWITTFTLVNKGSFAAGTQLSLLDDYGNPLAVPLSFPQQPSLGPVTEAALDQTIGPNASLIVAASGPPNVPFLEGDAQMASAGAVDGFAIFHYNPSGQEAVVPLGPSGYGSPLGETPLYAIPFDNTNGVLTGIAVENSYNQALAFPVSLSDDTGTQLGTGMETVQVGANGHTSFVLSTQFPVTANIRGTIVFGFAQAASTLLNPFVMVSSNVLGIRYTPPGTLTTIPPIDLSAGAPGGLLPHIAAGNGWQTTFVLVNSFSSAQQAHLNFFDDNGNPLPLPLTIIETGSTTTATLNLTIARSSSLWIQTTGSVASALLTGSAQLSAGVSGFAIYRYNPNGQEAVVPLETRNAASYLIAFDNTNGTSTGIALSIQSSEPAETSISVPVVVRDDSGNQVITATIPVAANGHVSQVLTTLFPTTANIRGTVEFDTPSGASISVLGIRSPPALTFTTLPALAR